MTYETVWTFNTARFSVSLEIAQECGFQYDGDDETGETQAALDSGDLVAFDSRVVVRLDGREVAADHLGASVYRADDVAAFWTAHRDKDPMNRNCEAMRAARGQNVLICHYFPDMVRIAISEAREALTSLPALRAA
ncbi:hypothetical protein [Hoeflea sp.]|uniref:hypothetical protein n=1 Tax=Hoeflea sp. TaxID=1940281 RepID=UPI003B523ACB